jgi:hypothetical protein
MIRGFPIIGFSVLFSMLAGGTASAGQHTWDVNEVFSNSDGTIQFVELEEVNGTPNETGVIDETLSSDAESFVMNGAAIAAPTSNKFYLIATQGFADLPGAPTPDVIIPAGSVPFINTAGDTIDYSIYDSWTFGAIPTNGIDSLDRTSGVGASTPTNYAGETFVSVPTMSPSAHGIMMGLIVVTAMLLPMLRWPARRE